MGKDICTPLKEQMAGIIGSGAVQTPADRSISSEE
jgi:hypothetical protein